MKKTIITLLLAAILIMPQWAALNSRHADCGNCGRTMQGTLKSLTGTVMSVSEDSSGKGRYQSGIHLVLKEGKKMHSIHLGPREFLKKSAMIPVKGEKLTVTAFFQDNGEIYYARTLKKGKDVFTLRDREGRPEWRLSKTSARGMKNRSSRFHRGNFKHNCAAGQQGSRHGNGQKNRRNRNSNCCQCCSR